MPARIASRGLRTRTGLPLTVMRPDIRRVGAGNHARQLRPPGAQQPGDAEHFATVQREAHVAETRAAADAFHAQDLGARRPRRRRVMLGDVPVRHHPDELGNRCRQRSRADVAAVAQHRRPMSDPGQLLQAVGNVDDGAPFAGESADGGEQLVDLRGRQRRGRLVHDQDSRAQRERLRDFDHLLLGHAQSGAPGTSGSTTVPSDCEQRARPFARARRDR